MALKDFYMFDNLDACKCHLLHYLLMYNNVHSSFCHISLKICSDVTDGQLLEMFLKLVQHRTDTVTAFSKYLTDIFFIQYICILNNFSK